MKFKKRRILQGLLLMVLVAAVSVFTWMAWPISHNEDAVDPAIALANEISGGEIYAEGYSGAPETRIHYVEAGEGETVLFLHGFPSYWFSNFRLIDEIRKDYRVIAIDGLGVGRDVSFEGPLVVFASE